MRDAEAFSEKSFFLRAFRGQIVGLALHRNSDLSHDSLSVLARAVEALALEGARVLILCDAEAARLATDALRRFSPQITPCALGAWSAPAEALGAHGALQELWRGLRRLLVLDLEQGAPAGDYFARLGRFVGALRLKRLLLCDADATLPGAVGDVGFVNLGRLEQMAEEPGARQPLLRAIHAMLCGGVDAVSLCCVADIEAELFTYQGHGVFFSPRHYCQVRALGINDYAEVERLVRRGEREGYLMPRPMSHLLALFTDGVGAFVAGRNLAGVAGLLCEPYADQGAAEVISIYALTRYKGEGIGGRLLTQLAEQGRAAGLRALFASTQSSGVLAFFQRNGFVEVPTDALPAAKWRDYDPQRRKSAHCVWMDLDAPGGE
ncbi:putative N-acetyltransferase GCN5 [Magnetofaba australis IT-1]|uniref:Amino-acid acetyltransferase n=2 Tax=Magnetofaba TaxID=1472292 RepID=A0A1Y2K927_9PROT|nr:putative N-acetyltransferase GCN5 [Magnetofaba australis IT-1]